MSRGFQKTGSGGRPAAAILKYRRGRGAHATWAVHGTAIAPDTGLDRHAAAPVPLTLDRSSSIMAAPFTAENSALVLIDHQLGTLQLVRNLDLDHVKRATLALAQMARVFRLPVVLTSSQEERIQGPLLPTLAELLPEAYARRIRREGLVNAWSDQAFRQAVAETGRPNLIMAGITTDVCLIYPAIDAVGDGYGVQAVLDASGSPFDFSEEFARRRMAEAGVVLTAANTLIAELTQDWSTLEGQELIQLLFTSVLPPIAPTAVSA